MGIDKTAFRSWKTGQISKGCSLCVEGRKSVLFATGICPADCYYCPISDKKKGRDVVHSDEWPTEKLSEIAKEKWLATSKGAGITGGDPLARISRTISFIIQLKKTFGKKFHIHLYTPLELVNERNLGRLHEAGLDEIRVHPSLENKKLWEKISLLKKFNWKAGIEIPVIPGKGKGIGELINFSKGKVDFINLNELEISDTNANKLVERGFIPKDRVSYGVKGSGDLAVKLLKQCSGLGINAHYCTASLKDAVQLAKRIRLRAKNAARPFDIITSEGMLVRGAIYLQDFQPSFGSRRKIEALRRERKNQLLKRLNEKKKKLRQLGIGILEIDKNKLRLLTAAASVKNHSQGIKKLGLKPAIVEEYPTYDALEVEVEFV